MKPCKIIPSIMLLLMVCVLLAGVLSACGSSNTTLEEGLKYTLIDNSYYEVSGIGNCTEQNLCIPTEYKGLPVKSIGVRAFKDCKELTSVMIPDSVTSIGEEAFQSCHNLTGLMVIPDGVKSIGDRAFYGCSNLTNFRIPDSVTSIGPSAFYGCTGLVYNIYGTENYLGNEANPYVVLMAETNLSIQNYVFHPSTRVIYDYAFRDCLSLKSVMLNSGLKSIGDYAFQNCMDLKGISIPNTVTNIGDYAFVFCDSLTSVIIGSGVSSIGDGAFYKCSSLSIFKVETGNSFYHDSGNCLIETASKTLISGGVSSVIPTDGSVTSIGKQAFSYCSRSLDFTIPDSVTSIGGEGFSYCQRLVSITLPNSVTSIGSMAFLNCSSLTTITFIGTQEQWDAVEKGEGWKDNCHATVVCTETQATA